MSTSRLHPSDALSTLSMSSVGLARLRRSNSILRLATEKAKKVLSIFSKFIFHNPGATVSHIIN